MRCGKYVGRAGRSRYGIAVLKMWNEQVFCLGTGLCVRREYRVGWRCDARGVRSVGVFGCFGGICCC